MNVTIRRYLIYRCYEDWLQWDIEEQIMTLNDQIQPVITIKGKVTSVNSKIIYVDYDQSKMLSSLLDLHRGKSPFFLTRHM